MENKMKTKKVLRVTKKTGSATKKVSSKSISPLPENKVVAKAAEVITKMTNETTKPLETQPKPTSSHRVRFYYVRDHKELPVGCVAYKVSCKEKYSDVEFAVSSQNPSDQWNRSKGREIALLHLVQNPLKLRSNHVNLNRVLCDILVALKDHPTLKKNIPTRIKKNIKHQKVLLHPEYLAQLTPNQSV